MKAIRCPVLLTLVIFVLTLAGTTTVRGAERERILHYHSRVAVNADASLTVTETIRVLSTGREIKRGIVREFPTTYRNRLGATIRVRFEVRKVLRDGRPEQYHLKHAGNGQSVYIGQKDVFLDPGEYTYTLVYETDRQLGYFDDSDELYWNVTGSSWNLPLDHVEATVELPPNATALEVAGYTGPQDARGADYAADRSVRGQVSFATTRPLKPFEGLTVAVSWPKGHVAEPTAREKLGHFLSDNGSTLASLAGFVLLLLYYFAAWLAVGRDPAPGVVIPLFEPPDGLSPAGSRFISRMGFDHKTFAAAVVNLAVKEQLTIEEQGKVFTLRRTGTGRSTILSRGEDKVLKKIFAGGRRSLVLKNTNHTTIKGAMEILKRHLKVECEKVYFVTNRVFFVPGLVITVLALAAIVLVPPIKPQAAFMAVWLSFWTLGCSALALRVYRGLRTAFTHREGRVGSVATVLVTGAFAFPFFIGEFFGLGLLAHAISIPATVVLLAILLLNVFFYQLLKAPTPPGRVLMDRIEGFGLYLGVAEKEQLRMRHPPEKTPKLFERYLPYAMALDLEDQWSNQFSHVLATAAAEGASGWSPRWYSGKSWSDLDASTFATSLGSGFSSAISSSSSAPGSSSGSGGGGSSGGGGGGGGGGGW